jgi:hypothetical protein
MDRPSGRERRSSVRVPLGCEATILPAAPIPRCAAVCLEIGVGGMTLLTDYVPREDEVFEVMVRPPGDDPFEEKVMHSRVKVRRCQSTDDGRFELGVQIIEVLK